MQFYFVLSIMLPLQTAISVKWALVNIVMICLHITFLSAALGPSIQLSAPIPALNTHCRALYTIQNVFLSNFTSKTCLIYQNMMKTEPLACDLCCVDFQTQADLIHDTGAFGINHWRTVWLYSFG